MAKKGKDYDLIVIGGGAAALGAAIYAGRFEMKTAVIGESVGGAMLLTKDIENYPGFKSITGMDLTNKLREHAKAYGAEIIERKVERIEGCEEGCFNVFAADKKFHTKTVIFATGTEWRKLNVPGEKKFATRGVHYCALCDGAFYKDKIIGVVGGSDSAAKEALLLSEWGKKVYIIYRGDKIKAEPINLTRVKKNKKIEIITNTNVIEIKGNKFMSSVVFDRPYKSKKEFKVDGLFIEIGHIPKTDLTRSVGIKLDGKGYIIADGEGKTNVDGFFAAGDVVNNPFKQIITSVAQGTVAAYSAYQYNSKQKILCGSFFEC